MSKAKSFSKIIFELYPIMPDIRNYIKQCHKKIKDRQCDTCKYYFACDCDNILKINSKKER